MTDSTENTNYDGTPGERPYHQVVLPNTEDKPYSEWSANERRAYLLAKIRDEYGLPSDVPRVDMGEKFDVHHSQIYQDVEILKEYMSNYMTEDFEAEAFALFKSAIKNLKDEDPYKAIQAMEKWSGFLEDRGEVENESEETVEFTSSDDMDISFNVVGNSEEDENEDE